MKYLEKFNSTLLGLEPNHLLAVLIALAVVIIIVQMISGNTIQTSVEDIPQRSANVTSSVINGACTDSDMLLTGHMDRLRADLKRQPVQDLHKVAELLNSVETFGLDEKASQLASSLPAIVKLMETLEAHDVGSISGVKLPDAATLKKITDIGLNSEAISLAVGSAKGLQELSINNADIDLSHLENIDNSNIERIAALSQYVARVDSVMSMLSQMSVDMPDLSELPDDDDIASLVNLAKHGEHISSANAALVALSEMPDFDDLPDLSELPDDDDVKALLKFSPLKVRIVQAIDSLNALSNIGDLEDIIENLSQLENIDLDNVEKLLKLGRDNGNTTG